jgi:serine/threonine-protein kinase HipA
MDRHGKWNLAPAFDVVWAFNPVGNGKRDDFTRADLAQIAKTFGIKNAKEVLEQVGEAVALWPDLGREAGVPQPLSSQIESTHRLALLKGERAPS